MDSPQPPLRSERLPTPRDATVPTHKSEGPLSVTAPTIESVRRILRTGEAEDSDQESQVSLPTRN